jgi:hypothetical protein
VLDIPKPTKRATCSFEPTKDTKEALESNDGCTVRIGSTLEPECTLRIGSTLEPEQEERLARFLKANLDVFAWKPSDMLGIPR